MYEQWDHTYRLRPYFRNVGIVCTSFFLCAWVGSVLAAYFNIDGSFRRPALAIAFFSVVWGGFTLLGVWLILAYLKYRLFLNDDVICHVGVLYTKSISQDGIHELKWRLFPQGGSCVLTSLGTKLKIEFNNFTGAEKTELIAYLHQRVTSDRQTNWDPFHDRFLANSPERTRQQHSTKRILVLAIFGFAAVFCVAWLSGLGIQYLAISIMNLLVGAWVTLRDRSSQKAA